MNQLNFNSIIIISGATATGKTSYSIKLALQLKKEGYSPIIINFDSLLFYKELTIGTAKPTPQERFGIEHKMIDICSVKNPLNAHQYIEQAMPIIEESLAKQRPIILVGGSAFYIRALVKGMYNSPKISDSTKNLVNHIYQQGGIDKVRDELKKHDLKSFQKLHPNDHYRNLRALEHWIEHGIPLSQEQERLEKNMPYNFAKNPHGWEITHHYLSIEKSRHWQIIRERVIQMINNGLINEVEHLLSNGFNGNEKPLQSIGYKETISYLKNEIKSQEELLERIYINTRRLAKSQKTFFKKINPKETIHL